ncbi:MAG: immunoglobulin domain-containing protein [Phycisphaeraceae bacterium]|nr:immunoglobulin domain-containing protein [Phycisphaeraceae bacterium]
MSGMTKAAVALILAGACGSAHGQSCGGQWLPGDGVSGVNGSVNAMTVWDPDGAGPQPELLIIAGSFSMVGRTGAANIAAWDGQHWMPLGTGTSGTVKSLAVFEGKLWAGGTFSKAGGNTTGALASWNGSSWAGAGSEQTSINALQVFNGELVAAGSLKVSGNSTPIGKWNGAVWSFLGPNSTVGTGINALTIFEGKLIAAGSFSSAGGKPAGGIASWDGSWIPLGSGVPSGKAIKAIGVYDGQLFAGGNFTTIGGISAMYLARWTGTQWEPSGAPYGFGAISPSVNAITVFEGKLIAGGDTASYRAMTWDGHTWGTIGQWFEGAVFCFQRYGDSLFAGTDGSYRTDQGRGILEYNAGIWRAISKGFTDNLTSVATFDGSLVVGGGFSRIDDTVIERIANWNGAFWKEMTSGAAISPSLLDVHQGTLYGVGGFVPLASWTGNAWAAVPGLNSFTTIRSLSSYQGKLMVGGDIQITGVTGGRPVAVRDGVQWQTFGSDLIGQASSAIEFNGEVVACSGSFLRLASNPSALGPFRFDGSTWHSWPVGVSGGGRLFVYGGKLLLAGTQIRTAGGSSLGSVVRWDDDHWSSLGGGIDGIVYSLAEYNGDLIVGGSLTQAGGVAIDNIARWNGTQWSALRSGVSGGQVTGLAVNHGELAAIGDFLLSDGEVSAYFARWTDNPTPWVAIAPESKPVNQGLTLTLSAAAASGYENVSYQWKRNGAAISDGPGGASAGGGTVSGASGVLASPSDGSPLILTISNVQASDAGEYTVAFSNTCNTATSELATVSVNTCPGDLNADGLVNDADFAIFASAYDLLLCGAPTMPIGCLSDCNGDGVVDDADFQVFVVAYGQMVCE